MPDSSELGAAGHVFISYVREDLDKVKALKAVLEAAGIPVWTDKSSLGPGEDWKLKIQQAITERALVFIACFSTNSENKPVTYQNEELTLAVEQVRLRAFDQAWLMPIRFDDCQLPVFRLGAGRTLNDLNRTDLFGEERELSTAALIAATLRVLGASGQVVRAVPGATDSPAKPVDTENSAVVSVSDAVKAMLHESTRQIGLEELVLDETARVYQQLNSEDLFPTSPSRLEGEQVSGIRTIVEIYELYLSVVLPLGDLLATGCAWGAAEHERLWAKAVQTVGSTVEHVRTGQTVLLDLRSYPLWPVIYAGGLGALSRRKYGALRSITSDAITRRDGRKYPVVALMGGGSANPVPVASTVLALQEDGAVEDETITALLQRGGLRYTPISDQLHSRLRPMFRRSLPDAADYDELFDEFEILLGLVIQDASLQVKEQGGYLPGWHFGRFTWKGRLAEGHQLPEQELYESFKTARSTWGPLEGGMFGGSVSRAEAAFERYLEGASEQRRGRW